MKKILMSAACLAALGAAPALAQDEGGESAWDISGTFGVVSDYKFRGFTQTDGDAAIQAGATVSHDSGFYVGVWGSNVDFNDGETDFEVDFFVGYGGAIGEATSWDVNLTYFSYPNAPDGSDYDYFEFGAGITHDFGNGFTAGGKVAFTPEYFGDTGTAWWVGVNAGYAVTEWLSVSGNLGYQMLDDDFYFDDGYMHYDIGATVTYGILNLDVRWVATDSDDPLGKDKVVGSAIFEF